MVVGAIIISVAGLFIIRLIMPAHKIKLHNDVAGFIFATLGVIYAVLIAFMVIVAWQDFDRATTNVTREANYIADVYRDSEAFSPAFKNKVRTSLDKYVKGIVEEEWPLLSKGQRSTHVQDISTGIWKLFGSYEPKGVTEKIFFEETVRRLNDAGELRRQRILDARTGIHPVLWFVLIFGGLITILFTLFFGTENFAPQIIMTSMLATLIALVLFTIMVFDYPYSGSVSISPDNFKLILQHLSSGI
jgi:cation transporter-like permease